MPEILFDITNTAAATAALIAAWGIFVHARQFGGETCLLRRFAAATFTVLAAERAAVFSAVRPQGVEVGASLPLVLTSIVFILITMGGTAAMGRRRHCRNFSLWVLMLMMPCVFLLANALMTASGNYHPLFSWGELAAFRDTKPIVYYGRAVCVAILSMFWLLAAGMLTEAYIYHRKTRTLRLAAEDAEQRDGKVKISIMWALLTAAALLPLCLPYLAPHIVYNVLLITALTITVQSYRRHVRYISARNDGRIASQQIARRVPVLLTMESGGKTDWGVTVQQNPFFANNSTLYDVAQALGVDTAALSEYILQNSANFLAWMSDQRLRHCADQITSTGRKLSEIALSCGYNDLPNFTRAFKRQFGVSPREYRKQNS